MKPHTYTLNPHLSASRDGGLVGPRRPRHELRESSSCPRGFTLIEIIAVVFILSLVIGLVIPSISPLAGHKVQSDAKRLAGILRYMNDSAIGTKKTLRLIVDLDRKRIRYEIPEGERSEPCDTLSGLELQSKGLVTAGEVTLFFGPLGGQEHVVFHLDASGKNATSVAFNPVSGRVRITDGMQK